MIVFEVPTPFLDSLTEFTTDRLPEISSRVHMLQNKVEYGVLEDSRADGVNAVRQMLAFRLVNLPEATAKGIDSYFASLKSSSAIDIAVDSVEKQFVITEWTLDIMNQKFMSISATCEEAFNAA